MKAVEYTAPVLADGRLEIPDNVKLGMHLRAGMQVKVILLVADELAADDERLEARRAAVWRGIDQLRALISNELQSN